MALITNDFVFIHTPRTGGTFCRKVILNYYPDAIDSNGEPACKRHPLDAMGVPIPPEQHALASAVERRIPETLTKRFVGFVRHPLSWYRSMWNWAVVTGFQEKLQWDELARRHWLATVWSSEYEEFIDRVLAMKVPRAWVRFHELLTRQDGICEVGRYENLASDLERLTGCKPFDEFAVRRGPQVKWNIRASQQEALLELEKETIKKWYPPYGNDKTRTTKTV